MHILPFLCILLHWPGHEGGLTRGDRFGEMKEESVAKRSCGGDALVDALR
jgi:hypothetical protein